MMLSKFGHSLSDKTRKDIKERLAKRTAQVADDTGLSTGQWQNKPFPINPSSPKAIAVARLAGQRRGSALSC
jgi:hypothetical protein